MDTSGQQFAKDQMYVSEVVPRLVVPVPGLSLSVRKQRMDLCGTYGYLLRPCRRKYNCGRTQLCDLDTTRI